MGNYQTLEVLEKVQIKFLEAPDCGVCLLALFVLNNGFSTKEKNKIYADIKNATKKWPKYSGNFIFPIALDKTSKYSDSPATCFDLTSKARTEKPPYYKEYIALRQELIMFLVMHFSIEAAVSNQANVTAKKQTNNIVVDTVKTDK
jgi:hypothetical protein